MPISRHEVEKVALLSRLHLSAEEIATMTCQLGAILEYMELLSEVDTTDVEPLAHALERVNVFREDRLEAGLAREEALGNAPLHDGEYYKVPAVLGEM